MEYTEGNWQVEQIGNEGKCAIHIGSDFTTPFAHTFPNRYSEPQISAEEALINAHLIAAAPEMYEACKVALKHIAVCNSPTAYKAELVLNEAIAKAETA